MLRLLPSLTNVKPERELCKKRQVKFTILVILRYTQISDNGEQRQWKEIVRLFLDALHTKYDGTAIYFCNQSIHWVACRFLTHCS